MNSKSLLLCAGATALAISAVAPALSQSTPTAPAQRNPMHRLDFLNLTSEQQARIKQIRQSERSQIDAILTPEQKAQLQQERQNRKPPTGQNPAPPAGENQGKPPTPFASLNLTAEQRSRIEAIMRSSREQMDAVLTAQQRQLLQQHRQQHEQRRQVNPQGT